MLAVVWPRSGRAEHHAPQRLRCLTVQTHSCGRCRASTSVCQPTMSVAACFAGQKTQTLIDSPIPMPPDLVVKKTFSAAIPTPQSDEAGCDCHGCARC